MHLLIFSHHWEYFSLHKGVNDRVRWPVLLTISINLMYSTFLPVPHTETVISFDGVCYLFYSFTLTGNLVNQLNRFVLSFWNKKKTLHDFRSYYERERGGRKRGREIYLNLQGLHSTWQSSKQDAQEEKSAGISCSQNVSAMWKSTTALNFLFPSYPFYLLANLAWKYELLPQCLNMQQQLLHNLLLQKNLVTAQCILGWRGFNTTNKGLRCFSWK